MTDEAFEKYQSVWTAVHNLVDKMLSGESGAEDIRDKLTNEFRFWKRSGHDISAIPPQPEQEPVAHLWECIGRWSAYLVNNGPEADCAPPSWLVEAVKNATTPPQRKPLTDEEIQYALESKFLSSDEKRNWQDDLRVARATEAAHDIKEQQ